MSGPQKHLGPQRVKTHSPDQNGILVIQRLKPCEIKPGTENDPTYK